MFKESLNLNYILQRLFVEEERKVLKAKKKLREGDYTKRGLMVPHQTR